jgi:hypothetical protein
VLSLPLSKTLRDPGYRTLNLGGLVIGSWTVCLSLLYLQTPSLIFSSATNQLVTTKSIYLSSFAFNVSDVSHVKIYGVARKGYSFEIGWNAIDLYAFHLLCIMVFMNYPLIFVFNNQKGQTQFYVVALRTPRATHASFLHSFGGRLKKNPLCGSNPSTEIWPTTSTWT